jgi:glutathione S-transferase
VESATAERKAARAKAPVLYHIEISHYNEKARWALDYKGIAHVRKAPPPLLHTAWALWLTRRPTFPVLKLDGVRVGDSTRIIETLERERPERPLYPSDEGQRRRALALEEHFDEQLGPYIRRWLFHEGLASLPSGDFIEAALGSAPRAVRTTMRVTAPVGRRILSLRYGINDEAARVARDKTAAALDRIEAELRPSGYLVGDRFSVADLTAAALVFQLVRAPEASYLSRRPCLPPSSASARRRRGAERSSGSGRCTAAIAGARPRSRPDEYQWHEAANRSLGPLELRFDDAGLHAPSDLVIRTAPGALASLRGRPPRAPPRRSRQPEHWRRTQPRHSNGPPPTPRHLPQKEPLTRRSPLPRWDKYALMRSAPRALSSKSSRHASARDRRPRRRWNRRGAALPPCAPAGRPIQGSRT